MMALPITMKEVRKMPRAYIINVIYTITGDSFKQWSEGVIAQRNQKVTQDKDLAIKMDPQIAAIFRASTSVSLSKGISNNLMKENAKVSV